MDISNLCGVASAYGYANQIRNKSVSSSEFAHSLKAASSIDKSTSKEVGFNELASFARRVFSEEEVYQYEDNKVKSNEANILSMNNVLNNIASLAKKEKAINASDFKEVETANYKLVPESDVGALRIYINGESAGLFFPENMKIQEDAITGIKVLVGEIPGAKDSWYDAIPVTDELEKTLAEAVGVDEIPHKKLEEYYIGTHAGTGIRYVMRPGDEGRGGKVLLCNAADEARYKALGEEYTKKYPNLVTSQEAGLFYASLEIRGMAHRGENGIVMTHPDNISYNDNDDPKKNWSAKIDEKTWDLLLGWFQNHRLNTEEMTKFKYWNELLNTIGGSYERVWSDDEIRQGYLYQ